MATRKRPNPWIEVGRVIREERLARRWSQQDLANLAGVALKTVGNVELHRTGTYQSGTAQAIWDALGLPTSRLHAILDRDHRDQLRAPDVAALVTQLRST